MFPCSLRLTDLVDVDSEGALRQRRGLDGRYSGEDAVREAYYGSLCGHEGPHMREKNSHSDLRAANH